MPIGITRWIAPVGPASKAIKADFFILLRKYVKCSPSINMAQTTMYKGGEACHVNRLNDLNYSLTPTFQNISFNQINYRLMFVACNKVHELLISLSINNNWCEGICHYRIILQENSSGFILRSFSNSVSLCSLSFLRVFSNFSEGLSITIGSLVYDIILSL